MSHGNTEFHLRRLHQAGIVEKNKDGKRKIYKINEKMLEGKGIDLGQLINAPLD